MHFGLVKIPRFLSGKIVCVLDSTLLKTFVDLYEIKLIMQAGHGNVDVITSATIRLWLSEMFAAGS